MLRLLHRIGESPLVLVEWIQYLLLAWVLAQTLVGFGGFLAYGQPMIGISGSLVVLAAVHAIVVLFKRHRHGLDWELLLPLPWLVYAFFHYRFFSAAPWDAALFLTVYVQAYALYFITFNTIEGHRGLLTVVTICQIIVIIALMAAFFQFYQFSEWMVTLDRERNPAYLEGAAGFLMDPANLGSLLILFWPLSVLMVWVRRFPGPIRILNGFLVLAILVGLLISSHRLGMGIFLVVLLAMPILLERKFRNRFRIWIYIMSAMVVLLPFFWFATDALYERIIYYIDYPADAVGEASISSAWALFSQNPVIGQGLGSFAHLWETVRPEGLAGHALYPLSGLAGILGETGIVGLLLLAGPVLFLLARAFLVWLKLPFVTVTKEVRNRMDRFRKGHPGRDKIERSEGRMPSIKILLGGIGIGLVAFCFYALKDYSLNLPVHLFILACLLAVLAHASAGRNRQSPARWQGLVTGTVPLLLAVWAFSFGAPRFYSQHLDYTASERLDYLLSEPDRIFMDPGSLFVALNDFELATRANPENADAWTGVGRTHLARIHADIWPSEELAMDARPALEEALKLAPQSWLAHYEMARVLAILGEPDTMVKSHLERAAALAPKRVEPLALLGSLLLMEDSRSGEGRELVERALAVDPDYEPLRNTARRLDLVSSTDSVQESRSTIFTASLLAEQFWVRETESERVLGAGIMPPMEAILPEPES